MLEAKNLKLVNELEKDKETSQVINDMLDFCESQFPISKKTNKMYREIIKNDTRELFTRGTLDLLNRNRIANFVIANTKKSGLRKSKEDIKANVKFLIPQNNNKTKGYTASSKKRTLDFFRLLGFVDVRNGYKNLDDLDKKGITTNIHSANITNLNKNFILYLSDTYSKEEVIVKLTKLAILFSELGFYSLFKNVDWLNLENENHDEYVILQAKATLKEARKQDLKKAKSQVYTGSKENKSTEKSNSDNFYDLEEDSEKVNEINSLLPEGIRADLQYNRKLLAYSDVTECKKVFGNSEVSIKNGGRLSSLFNYGLRKEVRKWLVDSIGYVEVDMTAMLFNSLYFYETGRFFSKRVYDVVATSMLDNKKGLVIFNNNDKEFLSKKLANIIKPFVIQLYNVKTRKSVIKKLTSELYATGLDAYHRIELLKDFDSSDLNQVMYDLGLCNEKKERDFSAIHKFNIDRRNNNFLEAHGNNEENKRFLGLIGNFRLTARDIIKAVEKEIPELNHFMDSFNALQTQYIESETLMGMIPFIKEKGIIPLLVHDSLATPKEYAEEMEELFYQQLAIQVAKYKASRLEDLYDMSGKGSSVNTFINSVKNIYDINNKSFTSREQFKAEQRKFNYFTTSIIGSNTKHKKDVLTNSLWSNKDLDIILSDENLSDTSVSYLKGIIVDYCNDLDSTFDLHKVISSLYLYSVATGKYLLTLEELDMSKLVMLSFNSMNNSEVLLNNIDTKSKDSNLNCQCNNNIDKQNRLVTLLIKDILEKKLNKNKDEKNNEKVKEVKNIINKLTIVYLRVEDSESRVAEKARGSG